MQNWKWGIHINTKMSKKIELKYNPCNDRWHGERLYFQEEDNGNFTIINMDEEFLGTIERIRCGGFMHWCLLLEEGCYLSPGCNDEVRAMQKKCYSLKSTSKSGSTKEDKR